MFFKRLACVLIALFLSTACAFAQGDITVRSGVHPSYNRLVFDWPNTPDYTVAQDGGRVKLSFAKGATANIDAVTGREMPHIKNLKILTADPLVLTFDVPAQSRLRHFATDGRMVLDVYAPTGTTKMAAVKEESKKETKAIEPAKKPEPKKQAAAEPAAAQPVQAVETAPVVTAVTGEHVITLSSTSAMSLAVFERGGYLWIAADDPGLSVAPEISGPQKNLFGDLKKIDVTGGVAFRVNLPAGVKTRVEGGGLLWKIILSPSASDIADVAAQRQYEPQGALFWPLTGARRVLDIQDPVFEDRILAATVDAPGKAVSAPSEFVELRTLPSALGVAVVPRADDVVLTAARTGVTATRPGGLSLSLPEDIRPIEMRAQAGGDMMLYTPPPEVKPEDTKLAEEKTAEEKPPETPVAASPHIYNFPQWEMGGIRALNDNEHILMSAMAARKDAGRTEDLITLAKLTFANDRGPESLGYLRVALMDVPELEKNPEILALRGGAAALSGRPDEAIVDLTQESLKDYAELALWKSATLGALEDWAQAGEILPRDFSTLNTYPPALKQPLTLMLAEVALRGGKKDVASQLLSSLAPGMDKMPVGRQAAWNYLMGETARQGGDTAAAEKFWEPLVKGADDYYRAKAGLSLTKLQLDGNKITTAAAIDRLEGLRYAWRGDELETLINYRLGQVYIQDKDYLKGLSVLKNAATLSPESPMSKEVTAYMTKTFRDAFMNSGDAAIEPIKAVSIYDEFKELAPTGPEGDAFAEHLAERLVDIDLLGRAGNLLESLVTQRLQGNEKARVALRLAAIRLLDSKPEGAMRALDIAEGIYKESAAGLTEDKDREIRLLRARALAKMKKVDEAFKVLDGLTLDPMLTRLKVDTAWSAGRWDEAADALQDLILDEDISLTRPLTAYQSDLVLNRAIALNLAGNRVGLSAFRERFGDAMKQTDKAQIFDVITRPRQLGLIGARENVTSLISEVDMFKEFLDSYKKTRAP
jgi:predicted negative regulator of RcsB-dependent stress response